MGGPGGTVMMELAGLLGGHLLGEGLLVRLFVLAATWRCFIWDIQQ